MDESNFPQLDPSSADSGFTRAEKLGFAGLVILFIVIIYLGFSQFSRNLHGPFDAFIAKYSGGENINSAPTAAEDIDAQLKNKDTDGDGLSDYDELYIYHTSPYMADTDSDGIPDGQEIKQGTDPNCPQGKVCQGSNLTNPNAVVSASSTLGVPVESMPTTDQLLLQSILGTNPDPKAIRDFLSNQGMDKKILDKFSDAELVSIFKESISATSTPAANQLPPVVTNITDIDKITAPQIRELLKQQGANPDQLKKISDADLLKIFKEAAK